MCSATVDWPSRTLTLAMLDTYWNGGSPTAQNRYYDNFVISTERIGCLP